MALPYTAQRRRSTNGHCSLTSYDATGMVEDISDVIRCCHRLKPCYSMFRKRPADSVVVSWQEDELRAPSSTLL